MTRLPGELEPGQHVRRHRAEQHGAEQRTAHHEHGVEEVLADVRLGPGARPVVEVQRGGQRPGRVKISLSVLNELITAHSSGMVTSSAQRTSMPCEKTLRTLPCCRRPSGVSARRSARARRPLVAWRRRRSRALLARSRVQSRSSGGRGPVASWHQYSIRRAGRAAHDDREDQRDDEHRDADRRGVADLPVAEGLRGTRTAAGPRWSRRVRPGPPVMICTTAKASSAMMPR